MTKDTHDLPPKVEIHVKVWTSLNCSCALENMQLPFTLIETVSIQHVWNLKTGKKNFFDISKYKYLTEVYMLLIERRCQFLLTASHSRRLVYSSQDRPTLLQRLARSIFQDINEQCYAFVVFILFQQFKDKIWFASAYRGK